MARTTYQAPGVYVEEVPSAQRPIAGVGTNTVGFIGVVPDEIQYPERNPDYDSVLAELAWGVAKLKKAGADVSPEAIQRLDQDIQSHQNELAAAQTEKSGFEAQREEQQTQLDAVTTELDSLEGEAEPTDQQKEELRVKRGQRTRLLNGISSLSEQIESKTNEIQGLEQTIKGLEAAKGGDASTPGTGGASTIQPYTLKSFKVTPEPGETKLCTNFTEYRNRFGPFSADDPQQAPGVAKHPGHRALTHAVQGFFQNGGTRCFVARVQENPTVADIRRALENFESIDAIAIVAAPGLHGLDNWNELVSHCETCEDRFAILDCKPSEGAALDITRLSYDDIDNDLPKTNKNAAFYFPYIETVDPAKQLQDQDPIREVELKYRGRLHVPPSGHVAGIYARTDEERGVHKAPANAAVLGAVNVQHYIGRPKQELLNPQGVNVIRNMNGNILVWGARTIGGDRNNEWKYVNVRRLFLFVKESIDEGTQWVVFEPNDRALWGKIRRNVGAFLTNVWRSGALFGSTPDEAFYVKCDDETNPLEVREQGQVITEIGLAIVRPAEFVIFRISQSAGLPQ